MTNSVNVAKNRAEPNGPELTRSGNFFVPRVDIFETELELTLQADLPGVAPADVDLRYENGELVLQAQVQPRQNQGNWLVGEYEEGNFYRVFQIHESIDSTRIGAECKNGVLTVHLPKVEKARPKQVAVRGE